VGAFEASARQGRLNREASAEPRPSRGAWCDAYAEPHRRPRAVLGLTGASV
jgi:hypothetical protein